jgi:hypothetical protein
MQGRSFSTSSLSFSSFSALSLAPPPTQEGTRKSGPTEATETQFLNAYKQLLFKTSKKRFILDRRGPLEEGARDLPRWQDTLYREGNGDYAGFAALGAARCQAGLSNPTKQALHLLSAGNLFWELEEEHQRCKSLSLEENIANAMDCYLQASQKKI